MPRVELTELNDYIAPAALCTVPTKQPSTNLQQDVKINLQDCLACSGCITSAESVLIEQHQYSQLIDKLNATENLQVSVAISPQSVASLCVSTSIDANTMMQKLAWFFTRHLPAKYGQNAGVTFEDTVAARELVLERAYQEFVTRKQLIISSSCPGFVCFAEKSAHHLLLFISAVKSPQQLYGSSQSQKYTVTVMPCADKKLEATRGDFVDAKDVDLVLTTQELQMMINDEQIAFGDMPASTDRLYYEKLGKSLVHSQLPISSGGFLESVFERTLNEIGQDNCQLVTVTGRNLDTEDYLIVQDDKIKYKFGKCFGFRNIQNMSRLLSGSSSVVNNGLGARKPRRRAQPQVSSDTNAEMAKWRESAVKKEYDYIEVQACPSGCINGGGQLRATTSQLSDVEVYYRQMMAARVKTAMGPLDDDSKYLTQYHAVSNEGGTLNVNNW